MCSWFLKKYIFWGCVRRTWNAAAGSPLSWRKAEVIPSWMPFTALLLCLPRSPVVETPSPKIFPFQTSLPCRWMCMKLTRSSMLTALSLVCWLSRTSTLWVSCVSEFSSEPHPVSWQWIFNEQTFWGNLSLSSPMTKYLLNAPWNKQNQYLISGLQHSKVASWYWFHHCLSVLMPEDLFAEISGEDTQNPTFIPFYLFLGGAQCCRVTN